MRGDIKDSVIVFKKAGGERNRGEQLQLVDHIDDPSDFSACFFERMGLRSVWEVADADSGPVIYSSC